MRETLEEQRKVAKRNGKEIESFFCNLGKLFLGVNNIPPVCLFTGAFQG